MDIKLEYIINPTEFLELIHSVGWKNYSISQIEKSLAHTMYMVKAIVNGNIAGMGTVIGDFSINCMLSNVCVKPEYQGKGIGSIIVKELKKLIESNVKPGEKMLIKLTPTAGNENFYKKAGFEYNPTEVTGMYLWIEK